MNIRKRKVLADVTNIHGQSNNINDATSSPKPCAKIVFTDVSKHMVAEQYTIAKSLLDDPQSKEKPLLHLPVESKDAFSKAVAEYFFWEFRSEHGEQTSQFVWINDCLHGVFKSTTEEDHYNNGGDTSNKYTQKPLYWTPQSLCLLEVSAKCTVNVNFWVEKGLLKQQQKEHDDVSKTVTQTNEEKGLVNTSTTQGDATIVDEDSPKTIHLLALSAWAGSGKDVMAHYLVKNHQFKKIAFADVLKDMAAEQYNLDRSALDDPERKEKPLLHIPVYEKDDGFSKMLAERMVREFRSDQGERALEFMWINNRMYGVFTEFENRIEKPLYWTPRSLCILEGSIKRSVDANFWVKRAVKQIDECVQLGQFERFVISDSRYKNEINQLTALKKKKFKVTPVRILRHENTLSVDSSERDLDNYEFSNVLENKGSINDFFVKIESFAKKILDC